MLVFPRGRRPGGALVAARGRQVPKQIDRRDVGPVAIDEASDVVAARALAGRAVDLHPTGPRIPQAPHLGGPPLAN